MEIGPRDLALTHEEASSLLRNAGVSVSEDDVAELHWQAEGWPAGLYLAALRLKEGGQVASEADAFRGDDRLVSEYIQSEFLARISPQQRVFLTRTAVLERLCGPLCEAVLDRPGPPRPWQTWRGRTCCWYRWTRRASGTATITCSATCCWPSCAARSRS